MTPSIRRLLETALYADDVARTATFYKNLLGRRPPMLQSGDAGGVSIYFRDPDGRSVELAMPGLWPNY